MLFNDIFPLRGILFLPECIKYHAGYSFHDKLFKGSCGGAIYTETLDIRGMESKPIITALIVLVFVETVIAVSCARHSG